MCVCVCPIRMCPIRLLCAIQLLLLFLLLLPNSWQSSIGHTGKRIVKRTVPNAHTANSICATVCASSIPQQQQQQQRELTHTHIWPYAHSKWSIRVCSRTISDHSKQLANSSHTKTITRLDFNNQDASINAY